MSTEIKIRRGLLAQIPSETPELGEPMFAKDAKRLFIGDGNTPGGFEIGNIVGPNMRIVNISSDDDVFPGWICNVDTSSGIVTLDLPPTPVIGDQVRIFDAANNFGSNNCVLNRNGKLINNTGANYNLDGTSRAWVIYYGYNIGDTSATWLVATADSEGWFDQSVEGPWEYKDRTTSGTIGVGESWVMDLGAAASITLPSAATANLGDKFQIIDRLGEFGTYNVTVLYDSTNLIGDVASNYTISQANSIVTFVLDVGTTGAPSWQPKFGLDDADSIGSGGGGGSTFFTQLLDTPSSYSGQGGKYVRVNSGGTSLEFTTGTVPSGQDLTIDTKLFYTDGTDQVQLLYAAGPDGFEDTIFVGNGGSTLSSPGVGGKYNTVVGMEAGISITTGSSNMIAGRQAGENLTSGIANTMIGYRAGRLQGDNVSLVQTNSTSIFLGAETKSAGNGLNNEIVIGQDATGMGTNTVVLGNDNITDTYLKGNLYIDGTLTPPGGGGGGAGTDHVIDKRIFYTDGTDQVQLVYAAVADDFVGTLVVGTGGASLSHTTGTEGYYNTLVGVNSGNALTTGASNTAVGYGALPSATDAEANVSIGVGSGNLLTTGYGNILVGNNSGQRLETGNNNVMVGLNCGNTWDSSSHGNTCVGTEIAAYASPAGYAINNTIMGYWAGRELDGDNNTLMGSSAGHNLETGDYNVLIGRSAGRYYSNGSTGLDGADDCVYLGAVTCSGNTSPTTPTNEIVIGYDATGNGSNTVTIGNSSITDTYLLGNLFVNGTPVVGGVSEVWVRPESMDMDDTDTSVDSGSVESIAVVDFEYHASTNGSVWCYVPWHSDWSASSNIKVEIDYTIDGSDPTKDVFVKGYYTVISEDGTNDIPADSASDGNFTFDQPGYTGILTSDDLQGRIERSDPETISNTLLDTTTRGIRFKLTRDFGSDTYGGTFQLIGMRVYQD